MHCPFEKTKPSSQPYVCAVCCVALQVHKGVELRVKAAMARAEQLEAHLELLTAQHAQHTQQMQQQQGDLETALQQSQQRADELRTQLVAAQAAGKSGGGGGTFVFAVSFAALWRMLPTCEALCRCAREFQPPTTCAH